MTIPVDGTYDNSLGRKSQYEQTCKFDFAQPFRSEFSDLVDQCDRVTVLASLSCGNQDSIRKNLLTLVAWLTE